MATVRELIVELRANTDTKEAQGFGKALKKLGPIGGAAAAVIGTVAAAAASAAVAIAGATAAMFNAATAAGQYATEMRRLADMASIGFEKMQLWIGTLEQYGIQQQDAAEALREFNIRMGEAIEGEGEAAEAFKELGVSLRDQNGAIRDQSEVFDEVLQKLSKVDSAARRTALAERILGEQAQKIAPIIEEGGAKLEEYQERVKGLGITMSDEAADQAKSFKVELNLLQRTFRALWREIGAKVAPVFEGFIKTILDLVEAHREAISEGINAFILRWSTALGYVLDGIEIFNDISEAIDAFTDRLVRLHEATGGVVTTLALMAAVLGAVLSPLTATHAGIAALVVLFVDLFNVFTGGESFILDAIEPMLRFVGLFEPLITGIRGMAQSWWMAFNQNTALLEKTIGLLMPLIQLIGAQLFNAFKIIAGVVQTVWSVFSVVAQLMQAVWTIVIQVLLLGINRFLRYIQPALMLVRDAFLAVSNVIMDAWNEVFGFVNGLIQNLTSALNAMLSQIDSIPGIEAPKIKAPEIKGTGKTASESVQSGDSDEGEGDGRSGGFGMQRDGLSRPQQNGQNFGARDMPGGAGMQPARQAPQKVDASMSVDLEITESQNPQRTRRIVREELDEARDEQERRVKELQGGREVGEKGGGD